mgnify:CR=1 FL=1
MAEKRKLRVCWVLLGLLVSVTVVVAWFEPDEGDLFELCNTQGKPTVYRTVMAEGYYDGLTDDCWGCYRHLENTGYKFVEFSITTELPEYYPINEPGIYRVSRISSDSQLCHEKLTSSYTKAPIFREQFERNNWCFQVERYSRRQARYGYYFEYLGSVAKSPITGSPITAKRFYLLDHESDDILAETTDYGLTSFPFIQLSSLRSRKSCNSYRKQLGMK